MRIDPSTIVSFLKAICLDSQHRTAEFWRRYWFESGHHRRLLKTIEKLEPLLEGRPSLLDIGSFGELPLILLKFYNLPEVYASSLEGDVICYGKGRLRQARDPEIEIAFVIEPCDVERLPLTHATQSLEAVTCLEILEHLRCDPMFLMLEIHRVLKPDGTLILTTPNASSLQTLARITAFESPYLFSTYFGNGSGIGHTKEYSISEVQQLLDNAGFRIEKLETWDADPQGRPDRRVLELKETCRNPAWWREDLRGETIFIQARKQGGPKVRKYIPLYTENVPYIGDGVDAAKREACRWSEKLEAQFRHAQELEEELEKVRARLAEVQRDFEERSRWALDLDREVLTQRELVTRLQSELEERGKWCRQLDGQVNEQRSVISTFQKELENLESKIDSPRFLWKQLLRRLRRSWRVPRNR